MTELVYELSAEFYSGHCRVCELHGPQVILHVKALLYWIKYGALLTILSNDQDLKAYPYIKHIWCIIKFLLSLPPQLHRRSVAPWRSIGSGRIKLLLESSSNMQARSHHPLLSYTHESLSSTNCYCPTNRHDLNALSTHPEPYTMKPPSLATNHHRSTIHRLANEDKAIVLATE